MCDNGTLAQLDREMSAAYYALRARTIGNRARGRLKSQHKAWLGQRNNCGYRVNCLIDWYESRLYQLEQALDG